MSGTKTSLWLRVFVLTAVALSSLHCATYEEDLGPVPESAEADDGGYSEGVVLEPGWAQLYSANCDEWFSCDGNIAIAISDATKQRLMDAALDQAIRTGGGSRVYSEDLYTITARERGNEENNSTRAKVTAEVDIYEDADGAYFVRSAEYRKQTPTIGGTFERSTLTFGFQSGDPQAYFDFEIRSDREDFDLALGVAVEWE